MITWHISVSIHEPMYYIGPGLSYRFLQSLAQVGHQDLDHITMNRLKEGLINYNYWCILCLKLTIFVLEDIPFEIVRAGDHCERNMSRQMLPLLFIFGW